MILASQGRFPCELAAFVGRELRHVYLAASAAMWLSLIVEAMATCFRRAWRRRRLHQQVFDPAVIACYTKAMNHRLLMELLRNGLTSVVVILAILAVAVILVHVLP